MSVLEELESLLDHEKVAILNGELSALSRLTEEKSRLLLALSYQTPSTSWRVEGIRSKAAENASLLHSARRGLHAALVQISAAHQQQDLAIYEQNGTRKEMKIRTNCIEERA